MLSEGFAEEVQYLFHDAPCFKAGSFFLKIGVDPAVCHNILWRAKKKPLFS